MNIISRILNCVRQPHDKPFYAVVELMGHSMVAGLVTKGMFIKVEIPGGEVREYGKGAIYCIRHVTEQEATRAAGHYGEPDDMEDDF